MKKRKSHLVTGSKIAFVATMMTSPLVAAPESTPTPKPKADTAASRASQNNFSKSNGKTTTVGKDSKGRVIQKNSKGETFYLEPGTGKMVFVKWPETKPQPSPKK